MAGGYNNQFSQYQALPTNLQNYTGGTGSPALMNREYQQPGRGGVAANGMVSLGAMQSTGMQRPMMPGMPFMGMNPFAMMSPYAFMGGMGRNWGVPGGYNAIAQEMTGNPPAGMAPMAAPAPVRQPPVRQPVQQPFQQPVRPSWMTSQEDNRGPR